MKNYNFEWTIKNSNFKKNKGLVFGTFICGGGSSFGYKLSGFDHIGGVEIDKEVANVYKINHEPKYLFNMDIREFNKKDDLPIELFNLDILDGSPPCSAFSMAGSRENAWGKEKKFREGQANQTLDDLVFIYCDTILKLKPKTFVLENVKGLVQGNGKVYSKKIVEKLTKGGYKVQVFLLNAASMGVPQKRERVFFIGHKKEYNLDKLKLEFNEQPIFFSQIKSLKKGNAIRGKALELWKMKKDNDKSLSDSHFRIYNKKNYFGWSLIKDDDVAPTIVSNQASPILRHDIPFELSNEEYIKIGTFPLDYNFLELEPKYLIGMSVPPIMTARIADEIYNQWLLNMR